MRASPGNSDMREVRPLSQTSEKGLLLLVISLRSLEGIGFLLVLGLEPGVGGEVAIAALPLDRGVGIAVAKLSRRVFRAALAAPALFDNRMAGPSIITASRIGHEGTLRARLERCTNHDTHLLFCSYSMRFPPGAKVSE